MNLNNCFPWTQVSLLYNKYLKFCMARARERLWEHFHQICPELAQFINFVWTKRGGGEIMVYIHSREICETFAVIFCEDSLLWRFTFDPVMGQWFPSRRSHSRSLKQAVWCTRSPGPGNPISLVRFISFPQSHLQLPEVKTSTSLTGRWSSLLKRLVCFHAPVLLLPAKEQTLSSAVNGAACTDEDCNDRTRTALFSFSLLASIYFLPIL